MSFESLEEIFYEAYRTTQRQGVIDQLHARDVPDADLESIADRIVANVAHAHATDFRERLPIALRLTYADRRHWRSGIEPLDTQSATEVNELVRASYYRCIEKHLTVNEIIEAIGDFKLIVTKREFIK